MPVKSEESRQLACEDDIMVARASVKRVAALLNFSTIAQTKVVTVASELARNALEHGKGGTVQISVLERDGRLGICLEFVDHGPGIENIDQAMADGFTTGRGMGLGLGGSKRLMDEFAIESKVNEGTRVKAIKWTDSF